MNGIEKLTARIAADSRQACDDVLEQGRAQAAKIIAGYEAVAETQAEERLAAGRNSAVERIERMASVADLEARKLRLGAKQEMLEKAFSLAAEKLSSLPEGQYAELLTELAVKASTTGREALIFSVKDRSRYGKRVVIAANGRLEAEGRTGALTLSEESRDFRGGLYVQDGPVETNCTFAALLRSLRAGLSGEVADILFDSN